MKQFISNDMKAQNLRCGYLSPINERNEQYGIWLKEHCRFPTCHIKFDDIFLSTGVHYDLNDKIGTAKPLVKLEKAPFRG